MKIEKVMEEWYLSIATYQKRFMEFQSSTNTSSVNEAVFTRKKYFQVKTYDEGKSDANDPNNIWSYVRQMDFFENSYDLEYKI